MKTINKILTIAALSSILIAGSASNSSPTKEIYKNFISMNPIISLKKEESILEYRKKLVEKIIERESSGNPKAHKKSTGAIGLMQITSPVLKEWNVYHPKERYTKYQLFDPEINRKIGEWYLFKRIEEHYLPFYGLEASIENKIAAYNWGIDKLRKIGDAAENLEKLPSETRKYIEFVKNGE